MSKKMILLVLIVVLSLAGCMGTPGDPEPARDSGDDKTGAANDGTSGRVPTAEGPRGATITLGANITEGSIPLDISFFLNSTGLEGFNLTWTLDVTGNAQVDARGDVLPATVTHTYEEAGDFLATLTVQVAGQETETSLPVHVSPLETWYLIWEEDDDDLRGCGEPSMNRNHTGESAECNEEGAVLSKVLSHVGKPVWATFTATEPTYGFPTGIPIEGVLHLESIGVGMGNLTVELLADGDVVAQTTEEVDDVPGTPEPGDTTRNATYPFAMKTKKRINENADLSFRVALNTLEKWHLQANAESPSGFTIGGPYEHGERLQGSPAGA